MAFRKTALIIRIVHAAAITLAVGVSGAAIADDLNDLLNETERALGRGGAAPANKSGTDGAETDEEKSEATKEPTKKKTSGTSKKQPSSEQNIPDQSSQPTAKPVLTPTDAESVNELISVGLRRESQLRVNERDQQLSVAIGVAYLNGSHRLTKDDDTFETSAGEQIRNVTVAYSTDLFTPSQQNVRTALGGQVKTIAGLSAGYLQGPVSVNRSGVQNGKVDVDYTIIPVSAGIGVRYSRHAVWTTSVVYGPTAEMLLQAGSGDSDSTSGFFVADALDFSIERRISGNFWLGLAWQNRGVLPAGGEAGHQVIALTINTPMVGQTRGM